MAQFYSQVDAGVIIKSGIPHGRPYKHISFGKHSTEADYIAAGLLPEVGAVPNYDKKAQFISGVDRVVNGNQVDVLYTLSDKPLAEAAAAKIAELIALTQQKEAAKITVNGVSITSSHETIAKISGAAAVMGRKAKAPISFLDADGAWQTATKVQLEDLQEAIWEHLAAVADACKIHHTAITALASTQAIADYDITTGWPA